jgi:hypothetical protein
MFIYVLRFLQGTMASGEAVSNSRTKTPAPEGKNATILCSIVAWGEQREYNHFYVKHMSLLFTFTITGVR